MNGWIVASLCFVGYALVVWFCLALCWAAAEADKRLGLEEK